MTEEYQNYLALCSHEYFHLWWVTRAKPAELMPYQLQAEQYSTQLWLYEGFTSYFDDLSLVRSGIITANQYLQTLSQTISRLARTPANLVQSLSDSSFTAWTKFYKQDENAQNAVVSYYAKGSLVALCLDAALRARGFVLEDLMRLFYREFSIHGSTEARIFGLMLELTHDQSLVDDLRLWITSAVPLPLSTALESLGVQLQMRAPSSASDLAGEKTFDLQPRDLGFFYEQKPEGLLVVSVRHHSPAQQAGIANQDLIVAVDGLKASEATLQQVLNRHPVGSKIPVHLFRQQRLIQVEFNIRAAIETTAVLTVDGETTPRWLAVDMHCPRNN
jgi:predicted metalloprotease with PDZ domain